MITVHSRVGKNSAVEAEVDCAPCTHSQNRSVITQVRGYTVYIDIRQKAVIRTEYIDLLASKGRGDESQRYANYSVDDDSFHQTLNALHLDR